MLQLAGNFDHESGAIHFLLRAMASQSDQDEIKRALTDDLRTRLPRPDDPATRNQIEQIAAIRVADYRRADEAAKLWIGQIKAAQGEFEPAIDYFKRWQNEHWQPSFNYSLARVYEAQDKLDEAIAIYREDDSPQRHGNLLRARRLEKTARETNSKLP
jgi:tetratricopeptide (TPR) repeat protein